MDTKQAQRFARSDYRYLAWDSRPYPTLIWIDRSPYRNVKGGWNFSDPPGSNPVRMPNKNR